MPDAAGHATVDDYRVADANLRGDLELYCATCIRIKTKDGKIVPFVWNDAQRHVHKLIERQKELTGKVRAIVLKGRQMGISTYIASRYYHRTALYPGLGQQTFILTHEDKATQNLFSMVKRMHEFMPEDYQPELQSSNANELAFAGQQSGYLVGTAHNVEGVGRSQTIQNFHGSEVGFWRSAEAHMSGVMQALPDARDTESILESTANGIGGEFHRQWQLAENEESDYIAIFVPWYWESEYRHEPPDGFQPSPDEAEYAELYDLDIQQIAWMHFKNIELGGQPGEICSLFRQEYPGTPVEAFQVTGHDGLIRPETVTRARNLVLEDDPYAPLVMGVDIAGGGDDKTRMLSRKGRRLGHHIDIKMDEADQMVIADRIAVAIQDHDVFMTFVDLTGIGRGAYDRLIHLGFGAKVRGVNFGAKATQEERFRNKRSEMWWRMKEWFEDEAGADCIDDDVLHEDVCSAGYRHDANRRIILEEKDKIKKRLERTRSPDKGDAAALTFAEHVEYPKERTKSWMDDVSDHRRKDWMTS